MGDEAKGGKKKNSKEFVTKAGSKIKSRGQPTVTVLNIGYSIMIFYDR